MTNREVIAVNQDSLGIEGFKYSSNDSIEVWFKPLEHGNWAMCFLNRGIVPKDVAFNFQKQNVSDDLSGMKIAKADYTLRNLWAHRNIGTTKKELKAVVLGHDVLMVELVKVEK